MISDLGASFPCTTAETFIYTEYFSSITLTVIVSFYVQVALLNCNSFTFIYAFCIDLFNLEPNAGWERAHARDPTIVLRRVT